MQEVVQNNLYLLDELYDVTFNELSRSKVFACVNKYKAEPTTINLKLAIAIILKWGDYNAVVGRYNKITEVELVNSFITDDYANRFHNLFVSPIERLKPSDCFHLFTSHLRINTISHAYFTKILYFFSPREKGLLILDKWLALNSMKLAIDYQDEYATKWYYIITPDDKYEYNGVSAQGYQDYIDFMQRAKTKLGLEYADQLETLLFGWRKSFNKIFANYDNPREVAFGDPFFIPAPSGVSRVSTIRQQAIPKAPKDTVPVVNDLELLAQFITMIPSGTMDFAIALGYKKDSPEYVKTYTTMNKILRSVQGGASCRTFFNETLPSIRNGSTKIINQYSKHIAQL